ncbi:SPP1 family predicted phage head-tail adaptor [Hoeflea halophila]|uniref:SPP1 family predicted phage head-tail adaptor n=1 Tax=Hoeflea halophila TaxID=714899 RepID=A0A286IBI9_9HYPH|nr:phage head closure protein [Hoeflea halophila]SOE17470.1 SPP1 family predicted phage head-tail adaptor [Hoeflea halophila]
MGAMVVDPGRLSARLVLETSEGLDDGQGGVSESWTPVATLWGRIEPLRAAAREQAGAVLAPISHRVTIRHRDDIHHAMRFVYGSRVLEIRTLRDPDESRRYLLCDCEECWP